MHIITQLLPTGDPPRPGERGVIHKRRAKETFVPRPPKRRFCKAFQGDYVFKPRSIPMHDLETTRLELGELEAMRLCDLDGLSQEEAGQRMGVSRGTVQRLIKRGRAKVVRALVGSRAILIEKGESDENLCAD
jgi:excisionase family DNA binding protein